MKIWNLIAAAALLLAGCAGPALSDSRTVELTDGWKIQTSDLVPETGEAISSGNADLTLWHDAQVPSTVLGVLSSKAEYAGALEGTDYYDAIDRKDFESPWWYVKNFDIPRDDCGKNYSLEFDGISYKADIWLNGAPVASSDLVEGPFRRFSFDVTDKIREHNVLAVKVYRADPGDFNIGFVDWNPRPADESMGIFRPVRIHISDAVSVSSTFVRSSFKEDDFGRAYLSVGTTLRNNTSSEVEGSLVICFEGRSSRVPVTLAANEEKTVELNGGDMRILNVKNPRLWWCNGLGEPEMYHLNLAFETQGRVSDSQGVDFGIRKIESYMTPEGHRGFILNGRKVLVKGAGWTDDIFLRNGDLRNDTELEYVKSMNLNAVRFENFWGTSQNLYDLCDRKGLLALVGWSCFWEWEVYSGTPDDEYGCIKTPEDMDLIAESLRDQIVWLRNHPSIIAWYLGSDKLPRPELESRYAEILPNIDDRPVVSSAKGLVSELSGPAGMKMVGPYDYEGPEYWYNPKAPGGAFGFNTETGIGAQMPELESILKMIPEESLWPLGKAYDFHCTTAGEAMHSLDVLKTAVEKRYGPSQGLEEFLLKAHHLDYDGTRAMFEAFRVNVPRSTGVIQWMLNSAWPSLYWQLYDWYLVPSAGFWSVRKACAPQQLVYNYFDKCVYAVSDTPVDGELQVSGKLYDLQGNVVSSRDTVVCVSHDLSSLKLFPVQPAQPLSFLFLELRDSRGEVLSNNSYCLSAKDDIHDWENYNWIRTDLAQHSDFSALSKLEKVELEASAALNDNRITLEIKNTGGTVAFFVRLALKTGSGEIVVPVTWEDNYISLQPGETRSISCNAPMECAKPCYVEISGWNTSSSIKLELK